MFTWIKGKAKNTGQLWCLSESDDGVFLSRETLTNGRHLEENLYQGLVEQLVEEGLAVAIGAGYQISWDAYYELLKHAEYRDIVPSFGLPPIKPFHASLASRGTLEDNDFSVVVSGWSLDRTPLRGVALRGAIIDSDTVEGMLPEALWSLVREMATFSKRPMEQRTGSANREAWGKLRRLAIAADANLDDFLYRSVVLTPEKLKIGLRKDVLGDDRIIEVQPGFDGAPPSWLEHLDNYSKIQDRYDIVTPNGVVQILITPQVRTVLEEIKRFPLRRVAGSRAQAFIINPYAALGEGANEVIDEQQFQEACSRAGVFYERFTPQFERDGLGYPLKVGLLIESADSNGPVSSESAWLSDKDLDEFVRSLKAAIAKNHQLLGWDGYDFEILGDSVDHLKQLDDALRERARPQTIITYAQVYDLTHYTSRVLEIGYEKPYYSPYIAKKKDDEGWIPENVIAVITWTPEGTDELTSVPISADGLSDLRQKVISAKASGKNSVSVPGVPDPIPLAEAEHIVATFTEALQDAVSGSLDPNKPRKPGASKSTKHKSPVLLANIQGVDYAEERKSALSAEGRKAELPHALREGVSLLPHQLEGVAWLQALYEARRNYNCRGAVLADDMGLGKTLQLLTLMAWILEKQPHADPMLVVAPVSLLENWKEEAGKFFVDGAFSILTAYGDTLGPLKVRRENIDERLITEDGITRFLRPGWVGDARIVLTTYETLRDLEFSFATEQWSLMVCDEAQKIKNPAAMVTRAAKKQNVGFKIACTGTPIENTLADIWCLFDFIQPGLLGALNDFGRRYRRPIEARTEEEKARVEELRGLVSPQILRRTKAEVAKELPRKIIAEDCKRLKLSDKQRELYSLAIHLFKRRNEPGANVPFKNHLGLLHYLRLICADPRRHGLDVFKPDDLATYRKHAPKLDWLLKKLKEIRDVDQKVIVFCEFRNIQRLLQHYIDQELGLRPDIINGDTAAAVTHAQSRQKRLRAFQEKPGFGVIILSPFAVGFGVNIQAANHVVHYTRTWNPAKEDQATDRAYRIGQEKDVFVYYPVVHADDFVTFDVKLDKLLQEKRLLAEDMLNGAGDVLPTDFGLAEVAPSGEFQRDEPVTLEVALKMNWEYFEALTAVLYARRGYEAYLTPATKDNGVDVVALPKQQSKGKLIQVKASAKDGAVLDWGAVKEVVSGAAFYANKYKNLAFDRVCLTNQLFNGQAHVNAELNDVELIEQPGLAVMLQETPVTLMDVEKVLYPDWASV